MSTSRFTSCVMLLFLPAFALAEDKSALADKEFVASATECVLAEVRFAEAAHKRSGNAEVRGFAQKVAEEHNQYRKALAKEAAELKLAVGEELKKENRQVLDRLTAVEVAALDREYLKGFIERHEKAIRMCESHVRNEKNPRLNAFCDMAIPQLKARLDEARKLSEKIIKT